MSHRTPGLFATLMLHAAGALVVFILLFCGIFALGFGVTRDQWQTSALDRVSWVLSEELPRLVGPDGALQGEMVNRALAKVLDPSVFLVVFQPDGTPVFWSWRGRSWYQEDSAAEAATAAEVDPTFPPGERVALPENRYDRLKSDRKLVPLAYRGTPAGSFYGERLSFEMAEENGPFLAGLVWALVGSLAGAGLGTTLFAWKAFRRSARQAGRVEAGLTAISQGRRDVTFPPVDSRELEGVAASALRLQTTLAKEQDLRRRWTQDIAHDLKTPLAGLRIQLEGLSDGVLTMNPERLRVLLDQVGHLEALTSDLLVLSRLESPELRLVRKPLSVGELIHPLRDLFGPPAEAAGRSLVWRDAEGTLEVDHELMHRALMNLLANALTHAEGPGPIEFDWRRESQGFVCLISNPGRLPQGQESLLFHRLHRGEPSRNSPGNGLGLTIAEAVIRLHGGALTLVNGPGTTVEARVFLPSCEDSVKMDSGTCRQIDSGL